MEEQNYGISQMKMIHNKGFKIEEEMKKWFHGKSHPSDSVDFETAKYLVEVKSCNLLINCLGDGNKKVKTDQLGRFFIKKHNHLLIKEISEKENKKIKYIFVIVVGKQKIWKNLEWDEVDKMISGNKENVPLKINQIFKKELRLR